MSDKTAPLEETQHLDAEHLIKILEGRWKLRILLQLSRSGAMRFSELARSIPRISKRMLTQQLKQMQVDGLVHRLTSDGTVTPSKYQLRIGAKAWHPVLSAWWNGQKRLQGFHRLRPTPPLNGAAHQPCLRDWPKKAPRNNATNWRFRYILILPGQGQQDPYAAGHGLLKRSNTAMRQCRRLKGVAEHA